MEIWVDLVGKGGSIALLLIFVWGLKNRWWVMGADYDEMKKERDYERDRANTNADLAEDSSREVVKRVPPNRRGNA